MKKYSKEGKINLVLLFIALFFLVSLVFGVIYINLSSDDTKEYAFLIKRRSELIKENTLLKVQLNDLGSINRIGREAKNLGIECFLNI